jgi:hypothetical protein
MSRSLSRVTTGGNAGTRGIVCEPVAGKTAHVRAAQAGSHGSTTTSDKFRYIARFSYACVAPISKGMTALPLLCPDKERHHGKKMVCWHDHRHV